MQATITNRILAIEHLEKKVVWVLSACVIVSVLSYVYLINDSVYYVASRKEAEEQIATTETDVTGLVSDYMAISATINLERAKELGFNEVSSDMHFATRNNTDSALTLSLQR